MTTKELIEALQKADPVGDLQVCVDNLPIYTVREQPPYYDGPLQELILDKSNPYYNVIGARIRRYGAGKVRISCLSVEDAIHNNPDLPVDLSQCGDHYTETVQRWRDEARQIDAEVKAWLETNKTK